MVRLPDRGRAVRIGIFKVIAHVHKQMLKMILKVDPDTLRIPVFQPVSDQVVLCQYATAACLAPR